MPISAYKPLSSTRLPNARNLLSKASGSAAARLRGGAAPLPAATKGILSPKPKQKAPTMPAGPTAPTFTAGPSAPQMQAPQQGAAPVSFSTARAPLPSGGMNLTTSKSSTLQQAQPASAQDAMGHDFGGAGRDLPSYTGRRGDEPSFAEGTPPPPDDVVYVDPDQNIREEEGAGDEIGDAPPPDAVDGRTNDQMFSDWYRSVFGDGPRDTAEDEAAIRDSMNMAANNASGALTGQLGRAGFGLSGAGATMRNDLLAQAATRANQQIQGVRQGARDDHRADLETALGGEFGFRNLGIQEAALQAAIDALSEDDASPDDGAGGGGTGTTLDDLGDLDPTNDGVDAPGSTEFPGTNGSDPARGSTRFGDWTPTQGWGGGEDAAGGTLGYQTMTADEAQAAGYEYVEGLSDGEWDYYMNDDGEFVLVRAGTAAPIPEQGRRTA
jgi:hypothetical protein